MAAEWDLEVLNCLNHGKQCTDLHVCVGRVKSTGSKLGRRCRNAIAQGNEDAAIDIWKAMPATFDDATELEVVIRQVVARLLCRRNHQDQVEIVVARWTAVLDEHFEQMVPDVVRTRKINKRRDQSSRYQRVDSAISISNHYTPSFDFGPTNSDNESVDRARSIGGDSAKMFHFSANSVTDKVYDTSTNTLQPREEHHHGLLVQDSRADHDLAELKKLQDRINASEEALREEKAQHAATKQARLRDEEIRHKQAENERQVQRDAEVRRQAEDERRAKEAAEMRRQTEYKQQRQAAAEVQRHIDQLTEQKQIVCEQRAIVKELEHYRQQQEQIDREEATKRREQAQVQESEDDLSPSPPCSSIDRQLARTRLNCRDNARALGGTFNTAPWAYMPSKLQVIIKLADVKHYLRSAAEGDQRAVEKYAKEQRRVSETKAVVKKLPFVGTVPALTKPAVIAARAWRRMKSTS